MLVENYSIGARKRMSIYSRLEGRPTPRSPTKYGHPPPVTQGPLDQVWELHRNPYTILFFEVQTNGRDCHLDSVINIWHTTGRWSDVGVHESSNHLLSSSVTSLIYKVLALALGKDPCFFNDMNHNHLAVLRLLCYKEVSSSLSL